MGIFDDRVSVFTTYQATLQVKEKVMGGTPKKPKLIEGWLRARMDLEEEELRATWIRTLTELGVEIRPGMSFAEIEAASEAIGATKHTNGFKVDANGLYLEGRCVKAMLKEATSVAFADTKFGQRRATTGERKGELVGGKSPRSYLAERLYVNPDRIYLGTDKPSGVDLMIGHVVDQRGARSMLEYVEYVSRATITFEVMVHLDFMGSPTDEDQWAKLWVYAQEN